MNYNPVFNQVIQQSTNRYQKRYQEKYLNKYLNFNFVGYVNEHVRICLFEYLLLFNCRS